jgi:uncharacterized protein (DUF362 family)
MRWKNRWEGRTDMSGQFTRRDFLRYSALAGANAALLTSGLARTAWAGSPIRLVRPDLDLAIAKGDSPVKNCLAAVEALGGFPKFVHAGDRVVIKPNPIGTSPPEMAVNTHPEMVEAVVKECLTAGAEQVIVLSHDQRASFEGNGIMAAAEGAGGIVKPLETVEFYREVVVPRSRILRRELIASDLLDADVFINMPIAKHHAAAEVTLTMKNLMGVNWDRIRFHRTDLHQCIAEIASAVPHTLIIMDANHVLLTNGPGGPGEVLEGRQVIAGVDPVAVDAFATKAFWRDPGEIRHIRIAHELGVGEMDLAKLKIQEFEV